MWQGIKYDIGGGTDEFAYWLSVWSQVQVDAQASDICSTLSSSMVYGPDTRPLYLRPPVEFLR